MMNNTKENKVALPVHGVAVFAVNGKLEIMPLTEGHFEHLKEQNKDLVDYEKELTTTTEENLKTLEAVKKNRRCHDAFSQLFTTLEASQASFLDDE